MATSRTGTAQWKNVRAKKLTEAIEAGQTTCPICNTPLDYNVSRRPNSPEVDHIKPHAHGGSDEPNNLRVVCRQCNQRMGAKQGKPRTTRKHAKVTTLINW